MKKLLLTLFTLGLIIMPTYSFAQGANDFEIIPKAQDDVSEIVRQIGAEGGEVRETYDKKAKELGDEEKLGEQFAAGVMTRNTLLDYVVYLVRFLSQIGILIGVIMIIYAGYLYASSVFRPDNMNKGKTAIINAIIGVLVVVFSYAIMKILTSAFIS